MAQERYIRTGRSLDRKPLTMSGMVKNLGINKSTISRALNKCLIETPTGIVAVQAFFVQPLTDGAGQKTREQALNRLSLLIKTEDSAQPFSDELLAQQLANANLPISRRTVAKYRKLLGVPNAFARRKN